ncbi:MAG: DUF166 domain-containing protein [Candidatus Bathyarchaeia archaeon]
MSALRLCFIYGDDFAERVIGNLCNSFSFCQACGLTCEYCRLNYRSFAGDIYGTYEITGDLPPFIEEPEKFLPENTPKSDVLIAVGLHPDLLSALPFVVKESEVKAVIVPIENKNWCSAAVKNRLIKELEKINVEYAFPKPFCSLEGSSQPVLKEFVRQFRIGRPEIEVEVEHAFIKRATVLKSAPCGSTWYVAQCIKGRDISKIEDVVAVAHHSYPCTASMEVDPELNDTILHKAGYIIREAVKNSIERAETKK